jgi:tetratricopeptide (TPR) repeat protein
MNAFAGRKKTALARAERLFKQRQFAQVIRVLEPQITSYRENAKYFYLLGMSCLSTGDYGGAYVYFRRCTDIDYRNTNAQLGLAVVHLRRGENEESLRIWLEILQDEAQNRYARLGLETVRKYAGKDEGGMEALFENRKDLALVPSPGFYLPRGVKWCIAVFLLLAFALVPAGLIIKNKLDRTPEPSRPEIAAVKIETSEPVLDTTSRAPNMLTEQEVRAAFGKIKELFDAYQDNHARREINRLLLSNAAPAVKNKVRAFIPFIRTPTFAGFPESFTYQEVMADPLLYEGCFVRWKGRISNINIEPNKITLDFLAGYEDQKVLLGIVPSWMEFAASLQPDFAYELIAQIALPSGKPGITLQILSLHELGL